MTAWSALPVVERLQAILLGFQAFVGRRGGYAFTHPTQLCLFWNGLNRRVARFVKLVAAIEAGTLKPIRRRAPRPVPETTEDADAASSPRAERSGPPAVRLPTRFGWLRERLRACAGLAHRIGDHQDFTNFHLGFEALLQDAELRRLYDLAPDRMGRLLRPLCPMLGVRPPEFLRLPRRRRAARKQPRHCEPRRGAAIQEHRPKPPSPPQAAPPSPQPAPEPAPPGGDYRHIFDPMNGAQMAERSRAWAKRQRQQEELQRRYPGRRLLW